MNIALIATQLIVILFAITIHEAAHGWAANKLGDPTAMILGRVTLNPIAHIDPFGTVLLPLLMVIMGAPPIGWAKPVPVNPMNLKNPKKDNLLISAAGPVSNMLAATLAGIVFKIIIGLRPRTIYDLNLALDRGGSIPGFNPIPILAIILFYAVFLNMFLAVFNLIPIPPLDGSGILIGLISESAAQKVEQLRPFGIIIVFGMLWLGILDIILKPIWFIIQQLLF
ncbi:MAG: site-2 protease family protein [Candidatus Aminicenantaceae bacterium]|jgi:Zn-dependent protease